MNRDHESDKSPQPDDRSRQWVDEVSRELPPVPLHPWLPADFSLLRCAGVGALLGILAGCTSLVFNVVGSVLWPSISGEVQHPLRLIQVYLTFPVGASALELASGPVLFLGCLLYLATGMLYGILFELALVLLTPQAGVVARLVLCSALALVIWVLNFYVLLDWLQPLLFGGRWIVELIPWWVGAATHLVFGWTMAFVYPLGTQDARTPQA